MTCGLVHASYSLPEWQAVKLTFFAPCMLADFPPISWLLTTSWSTTSFRLSSMSVYKTQIVQCAQESLFFHNFTGWEMLMYHILINIIPHPFYRRTAIKLLNSVEECFRNNFQTKKLGQSRLNFKKLFPLSNSCCHLKIVHIHFLIISYSKNIWGSPGAKVPTVTVPL